MLLMPIARQHLRCKKSAGRLCDSLAGGTSHSSAYCLTSSSSSNNQNLKSYEDIPGPKPLPFIGNLLQYKDFGGPFDAARYDKFIYQINEKYGDLVKWSLFGKKEVFIFKPEYVKLLYQAEDSTPSRTVVDPWIIYSKRKNLPSGLINSQGNEWKKQRSPSNQIVAKQQSVMTYLNVHNEIINEFVQLIAKRFANGRCEIGAFETELKLLTLEMISVVAFDHRLNVIDETKRSPAVLDLFHNIEEYGRLTSLLIYSYPTWKLYKTANWRKFEEAADYIFGFAEKYIGESLQIVTSKEYVVEEQNSTMLQKFLITQNKTKLSFNEIVIMMFEFLMASLDTTTVSLHWLLYEIATHAKLQDELFAEINAIYPTDCQFINEEHLTKIPLLKACFKESARIHSAAPVISRKLNQDLIIDNYVVPKDTTVNIGLIAMGNSERYFKNSSQFDPKRWLKDASSRGDQATMAIDPYASLPFGVGARMCVGRRLAEQKVYLILMKLLKNFRIKYTGKKVESAFRLIVVPDQPLSLSFTPRNI